MIGAKFTAESRQFIAPIDLGDTDVEVYLFLPRSSVFQSSLSANFIIVIYLGATLGRNVMTAISRATQ